MPHKYFDSKTLIHRETIKKYPRTAHHKRKTLAVFIPETATDDTKSVEDDYELGEDRERYEREKPLRKKYPKAYALVKAELARKGMYDSNYYFNKEIKEISVADLSETTLRYLEDWDTLEFGVNTPNLKPAVLRETIFRDVSFILDARKDNEFMSYLRRMKISLEECIANLQAYVEHAVRGSQLFRATELNVLVRHILVEDERWKSQFETRTSGGKLSPSNRSIKEERFFGFPDYSSDEALTADESSPYHVSKRPIYGYFTPNENGILNSSGTQPPLNSTIGYGQVHCKVKESKRNETTVSFGDTLSGAYGLTPFTRPHYTSLSLYGYSSRTTIFDRMFEIDTGEKRVIKQLNVKNLYRVLTGHYTEIQIHNGLQMKDIQSIHVSKGNEVSDYDIEKLRLAVDKYNSKHPDSPVELIVYY